MTQRDSPDPWRWALPDTLKVPPDELRARIDIYRETVVLRVIEAEAATIRPVSALDIARAFTRDIPISTGMLPQGALWWMSGAEGTQVALWRPPRVWPVALQTEAFKPPRRMRLPMPGLVFLCRPSRPPRIYAAKKRPQRPEDVLYRAPLFNVFDDGSSCPGTHKYPQDVAEHPESFFTAFFTPTTGGQKLSRKHGNRLLALWEELDGKARYPLSDLVAWRKVGDLIGGKST